MMSKVPSRQGQLKSFGTGKIVVTGSDFGEKRAFGLNLGSALLASV